MHEEGSAKDKEKLKHNDLAADFHRTNALSSLIPQTPHRKPIPPPCRILRYRKVPPVQAMGQRGWFVLFS